MQEDQKVDPSVDVSQWLQEVGRRKWPHSQPTEVQPALEVAARPTSSTSVLRRALLLALLLVVSLQYIYAFTAVEILSLPSLLVFVFTS
jgi:hypothetical protein